jgi:uncharacterized membrane protein
MLYPTDSPPTDPSPEGAAALAKIAAVIYALQAASFLVGISLFAATILIYLKRGEARGTWLATHFRWQIRTFWLTLLGLVAGVVTLSMEIGYLLLLFTAVWLAYRIIRGWLLLSEKKSAPS